MRRIRLTYEVVLSTDISVAWHALAKFSSTYLRFNLFFHSQHDSTIPSFDASIRSMDLSDETLSAPVRPVCPIEASDMCDIYFLPLISDIDPLP